MELIITHGPLLKEVHVAKSRQGPGNRSKNETSHTDLNCQSNPRKKAWSWKLKHSGRVFYFSLFSANLKLSSYLICHFFLSIKLQSSVQSWKKESPWCREMPFNFQGLSTKDALSTNLQPELIFIWKEKIL